MNQRDLLDALYTPASGIVALRRDGDPLRQLSPLGIVNIKVALEPVPICDVGALRRNRPKRTPYSSRYAYWVLPISDVPGNRKSAG